MYEPRSYVYVPVEYIICTSAEQRSEMMPSGQKQAVAMRASLKKASCLPYIWPWVGWEWILDSDVAIPQCTWLASSAGPHLKLQQRLLHGKMFIRHSAREENVRTQPTQQKQGNKSIPNPWHAMLILLKLSTWDRLAPCSWNTHTYKPRRQQAGSGSWGILFREQYTLCLRPAC